MLDIAITAVGIDKRRWALPEADMLDHTQHHIMGAEPVDIGQFALKRCRGIVEHWRLIVAVGPITCVEPGVAPMPERPCKSRRKIGMSGTEHIEA